MKKSYFITGLKLALLQLIIGCVMWLITALLMMLGLKVGTIGFWVLLFLIVILLSIFVAGWLAQKIWKWK